VHYSDGAKSLTAIVIAIDARAAVEQLKRAHKVDRVIQTKQLYSEEEMQKETIQNQEEDNDMTEENTNLREEIAEAMSGENISDETRRKAITLFEKAVYLKVDHEVGQMLERVTDLVDCYLNDYATETINRVEALAEASIDSQRRLVEGFDLYMDERDEELNEQFDDLSAVVAAIADTLSGNNEERRRYIEQLAAKIRSGAVDRHADGTSWAKGSGDYVERNRKSLAPGGQVTGDAKVNEHTQSLAEALIARPGMGLLDGKRTVFSTRPAMLTEEQQEALDDRQQALLEQQAAEKMRVDRYTQYINQQAKGPTWKSSGGR
jgi:hypothetical protein